MYGLIEYDSHCPYCGEAISLMVDGSVEQSVYTEDCSVCCQPILVNATLGSDGELESVLLRREDEIG